MAGFPPAGPGWPQMNLDIELRRRWLADSDSNDSDSRRHESSLPQPQHSVPQELRLPGPALGGGSLSTQPRKFQPRESFLPLKLKFDLDNPELHSNPHSNESVHWQVHGGSRHPINFDAPFRSSQPFAISVPQEVDLQRAMLRPAISLSHEQASTGSGQVMAEAVLSSFSNTQNFDSQRFDPSVGTSQVILETPLPASLAGSRDIYQVRRPVSPLLQLESRVGVSLRHTVSEETLGSSRRIDPPLTQFRDTAYLTRSQQQPFPTYQQDIQNFHLPLMDYSLRQETPTATSQLNLEWPSEPQPMMQGSTFQHFLQTKPPMSDVYLNLYAPPRLPPHFIPTSQDSSAGSHRTAYGKHGKDSSSSLGSHCAQEDVKSRLGHQRGVTGRRKLKERSASTKFIEWKPNTDDTARSLRTKQPLRTIMVQSQSLVEDKSHTLMVTSLFEKGFFPTEDALDDMANQALNTAVAQHPGPDGIYFVPDILCLHNLPTTAEDLRRWTPSQEGKAQIKKLKSAEIFLLPVFSLCVDPWKNKEEMVI